MGIFRGFLSAALSVAGTSLAWSTEPSPASLRLVLAGQETGCAVIVLGSSAPVGVCAGRSIPGTGLIVVRVEADEVWLRDSNSRAGLPVDRKVAVGVIFAINELETEDTVGLAIEVPLLSEPTTQRSRVPVSRPERP